MLWAFAMPTPNTNCLINAPPLEQWATEVMTLYVFCIEAEVMTFVVHYTCITKTLSLLTLL